MAPARQVKITFARMRASGVRGLLVYCDDFTCSHSLAISGNQWPDDVRLSDLEPRFRCTACSRRSADVRPDFSWNKKPVNIMGIGEIASAAMGKHAKASAARIANNVRVDAYGNGRCRCVDYWRT